MPACKKNIKMIILNCICRFRRIAVTLPLLGSLCIPCASLASSRDGLHVYSASTQLRGDTYMLDAQLEYGLSKAAIEALESGVPLTFEMEVEIFKPRKWMWDESIYKFSQTYQIAYHALTQQYIVTNASSGLQNNYSNMKTALLTMGRINDVPFLKKEILDKGGTEKVFARLRVSLIINELPVPMRPWAYISSDWRLSSEWFVWDLE